MGINFTVMDSTFLMIKPEVIWRDEQMQVLVHEILPHIDINKVYVRKLNTFEAEYLYSEHKGKHFYGNLISHITSGFVIMIEAKGSYQLGREIVQFVRDDHAHNEIKHQNALHGSDSESSAESELRHLMRPGINMYGVKNIYDHRSDRVVEILNAIKSYWDEAEKKIIPVPLANELQDLIGSEWQQ